MGLYEGCESGSNVILSYFQGLPSHHSGPRSPNLNIHSFFGLISQNPFPVIEIYVACRLIGN